MVFNTTFNNISVIPLVEEIRIPWENHWTATSHWHIT